MGKFDGWVALPLPAGSRLWQTWQWVRRLGVIVAAMAQAKRRGGEVHWTWPDHYVPPYSICRLRFSGWMACDLAHQWTIIPGTALSRGQMARQMRRSADHKRRQSLFPADPTYRERV